MERQRHLRGARARPDDAERAHPRRRARHVRGAGRPGDRSTTSSSSASPRSSCCRSMRSCRTAGWSSTSCATTGATTRSAFFAPEPELPRDRRAERDADRRSSGCTRPASRSSSTWSTTTPARRASAGRRCRSAASTTRATTGCMPDNPRHCINDTGCGNTVNTAHPRVIQLIMDSLRYWVDEFHVDGFRFDLGVTLGREATGFDPNGGFFDALRQDPMLARGQADLRAVGHRPRRLPARQPSARLRRMERPLSRRRAALLERRRRHARRDRRAAARLGRPVRPPASQALGVGQLHHRARRLHDGRPRVATTASTTTRIGEDNRDGADDNHSYNWGVEGPTDDPGIVATRAKVHRSMLMTLLTSHGTPMLLGGDEFGRTQHGNNNAYCQDSEISWVDWTRGRKRRGPRADRVHRAADRAASRVPRRCARTTS